MMMGLRGVGLWTAVAATVATVPVEIETVDVLVYSANAAGVAAAVTASEDSKYSVKVR